LSGRSSFHAEECTAKRSHVPVILNNRFVNCSTC
jgi:hypothetical protein